MEIVFPVPGGVDENFHFRIIESQRMIPDRLNGFQILHTGFFTIKSEDQFRSGSGHCDLCADFIDFPFIGPQINGSGAVQYPEIHSTLGIIEFLHLFFQRSQKVLTDEVDPADRRLVRRCRTESFVKQSMEFLHLFRGEDLGPDLEIGGDFHHRSQPGIHHIAQDLFTPDFLQFLIELLHKGSAFAEHGTVVIFQKGIRIQRSVPCLFGKNIVVEILGKHIVGFRLKKSAVDQVFIDFQEISDGTGGHGGDPVDLLAHVLTDEVSPHHRFDPAAFFLPGAEHICIGLIRPGAFGGNHDFHIGRQIAVRQLFIGVVCHLADRSFDPFLLQAARHIPGDLPDMIADSLTVFGIGVNFAPAGFRDLFAFLTAAPVQPVLGHDIKAFCSPVVTSPVFDPPCGSLFPGKEGFGILIEFLHDPAVVAEVSRMGNIFFHTAAAVRHQGKVFGMAFAEPLDQIQMALSVTVLHQIFGKPQTDSCKGISVGIIFPGPVGGIQRSVAVIVIPVTHIRPFHNTDRGRQFHKPFGRDHGPVRTAEEEPCRSKPFQKIVCGTQRAAFIHLLPAVGYRCLDSIILTGKEKGIAFTDHIIPFSGQFFHIDPGLPGKGIIPQDQSKSPAGRFIDKSRFDSGAFLKERLQFGSREFQEGCGLFHYDLKCFDFLLFSGKNGDPGGKSSSQKHHRCQKQEKGSDFLFHCFIRSFLFDSYSIKIHVSVGGGIGRTFCRVPPEKGIVKLQVVGTGIGDLTALQGTYMPVTEQYIGPFGMTVGNISDRGSPECHFPVGSSGSGIHRLGKIQGNGRTF